MRYEVLALNRSWQPHSWLDLQEAMILEAKGNVTDHLGESLFMYRGGFQKSGEQSKLETSSIIVIDGEADIRKRVREPSLTNTILFQRDRFMCAYCSGLFRDHDLTRDHIVPTSKGGKDIWMNVVSACKECNALKGDVLPGHKLYGGNVGPQGNYKMDPIFIPYIPCSAEYMILKNRNVKFDQMAFLLERVKNKKSRIFDHAKQLFPDKVDTLL